MRFFSLPKLAILGLGIAGMLKVSVDLMPMVANAEPVEPVSTAVVPAAAVQSLPVHDAAAIINSDVCEPSQVIADAIAEERTLLQAQRKDVADSEARLALAEESLKAERERLTSVRDEIGAQMAVIQDANAQDMTKLVELYRNMKPQVAAGIMDEIDVETAVQVIGAMAERDAAPIMGAFSLVRARLITKILLERSKLPADRNLDGLRLR